MAEIRKYDPAVGNAIAQALRAAMGDPVRPAEPGADSATAKAAPHSDQDTATSWVSLRVDPTPPATRD